MRSLVKNFLIIFLGSTASCKRNVNLNYALKMAGNNKAQLTRVLEHYSKPADSLKRRAAEFLISNMPVHHGYYGSEITKYSNIFSIIDTMSFRRGSRMSNDEKSHVGDSIVKIYGYPTPSLALNVSDVRRVSAPYLINNIDFAFKAWKSAPWGKEVNFNDFCEYILPYRVRDERVEYWRPQFYEDYTNMARSAPHNKELRSVFDYMNWNLNTETNFTVFFNRYYPFTQSVGDILKGRIGGCETTCLFSATCMRAAGLPVALDFIPHWGNTPSRHYMVHLVDHHEQALLPNVNSMKNTWSIVDFSTDLMESGHKFTPDEFPDGMYIQYTRTIPKVYRYTYTEDPVLKKINETMPDSLIAPEFRYTNFKDVTEDYVSNADITLPIDTAFEKYKLAYLCVFDVAGWKPVALTTIDRDRIVFKKAGRNIIYLPAVYDQGNYVPVGRCFYVDSLSRMKVIEGNPASRQRMKLVRKTALFSYTAYHTQLLKDGRFEGSDSPDFKNATLLYQIKGYPFYMNEVKIENKKVFRYVRYAAPPGGGWEADNIAELGFYDKDSLPLKGAFIGEIGSGGHEISKAFDNDMDSYYENAAYRNGWIGLDLGKNNKKIVSRIKFCPRNDTNCIIPGNEYELYYWDDRWVSLGVETATINYLTYNDAPEGAVFWLKCISGGHEERIFTYSNGKQVWW